MPNQDRIPDPIARYIEARAGTQPAVDTAIDVRITAGLARVTIRRSFHNQSMVNIEASMTFPVPVRAALFALTATIDGQDYTAQAMPRVQARTTYEAAVDEGRTAVLHEEVLRGIHVLSIAHLAPGATVTAAGSWVMPLAHRGRLRIPTTAGQVYGASPLRQDDDLERAAPRSTAILTLQCDDGPAQLRDAGRTILEAADLVRLVSLDAPIDINVPRWTPRRLYGGACDDRVVALTVTPRKARLADLDVALLIDRSGSMSGPAASGGVTKHEAVIAGLQAVLADMRYDDRCEVWEFNDTPAHVAATLAAGVHQLAPPSGGTEIGRALSTVFEHATSPSVIVLTDGLSHELDVQALAAAGRRVHVVLIGEDSLEANIGHLAALTGGELLIADGASVVSALNDILFASRSEILASTPIPATPEQVVSSIAFMQVEATWTAESYTNTVNLPDPGELSRAVAAYAAFLAIPHMEREAATELAVREGLVTHLTSLVLVDGRADPSRGIPVPRRIRLPTPRSAYAAYGGVAAAPMPSFLFRAASPAMAPAALPPPRRPVLRDVIQRIDWKKDPDALASGVLTGLDPAVAAVIEAAALHKAVQDLAATLGIEPVVLVVGLLAFLTPVSRTADRISRRVLNGCDATAISLVCITLGLIDLPTRPA